LEKTEFIFGCTKCGGQIHIQAGSREQAENWLNGQSGFCPAGGNHVELSFQGCFEYVGVSPEVHEIPSKEERFKATITKMLEEVKNGRAVLTAGNIGIPTIHNIKNARHCGFGFFEVTLPNGNTINFDAGGAMHQAPEPIYGWTYLRGDAKGWGYPYERVIKRLTEISNGATDLKEGFDGLG